MILVQLSLEGWKRRMISTGIKNITNSFIIIGLVIACLTLGTYMLHISRMTPERVVEESIETVLVKGKGCPRLMDCHEKTLRQFERQIISKQLPKPKYVFGRLVELNDYVTQDMNIATHPIMMNGHKQVAVSIDYIVCNSKSKTMDFKCSMRGRNHYAGYLLFTLEKAGRMSEWRIIDIQAEEMHQTGGV